MEQLRRICRSKGIECDERALHYIVREADGGLRDAESILDQVISYSGAQIAEKDVIDVIGVVRRDVAYAIVKSIVEKDPKEGLALIARTLEEGNDAYQVYKALLSFLRDLLMIKLWQGKPPFVFMDDEEYERAAGLLKAVEYYEIQNMVHHMLKAEDLIRGVFPARFPGGPLREPLQPVAASGRGGDDRCGCAQRGPCTGTDCRAAARAARCRTQDVRAAARPDAPCRWPAAANGR